MRKGVNPTKGGKLIVKESCDHRVIIPLHIPNEEGYFVDAFRIFKMCYKSLLKTSTSTIKISVVSNKCCEEINKKLLIIYDEGTIDELIIVKEGVGKINSVLKALRTAEERLITITDADVLFLNGWEDRILEVFKAFPMAGAVCPVPVYRKHLDLTYNIWFDHLLSNKIRFESIEDVPSLEMFAKSLGWAFLPEEFGDTIGTLKAKDGTKAVLGCSHFVATYKSEVFKALPEENSLFLIDGNSEYEYLDKPTIACDGYRLATASNNAYHLGNKVEDWMQDSFDNLQQRDQKYIDFKEFKVLKSAPFKYWFIQKVFKKILKNRFVLDRILKRKGLNKKQLFNFLDRTYN